MINELDYPIDENYIKAIIGKRYLGDNVILCGYCLAEEMEFIDIYQDYKCHLCKEDENGTI